MLLFVIEVAKYSALLFGIFILLFFVVLRIVRHYYHFSIPSFLTQLIDNPFRRKFIQKPHIIANRMQLHSGMKVVEIGPSKGNYTEAVASRILPDGKVYAVDIQQSVVKRLKEKIHREKIENYTKN